MMSFNDILKISDDLRISQNGDRIRVEFGDSKTDWISPDDPFLERISPENLNRFFLKEHLEKEIEIKNVLDEGVDFLNSQKYPKAIERFDRVIYYDSRHSQALLFKSHALCGQGHYVKALRFFKRSNAEDSDYHKLLLKKSSEERNGFAKIKRSIYAGDEAAARGEFEKAVGFYDRALLDPSRFKNRILFKLLDKKGFALIELKRFDEALASFDVSLRVHENDLAHYGLGYCQHCLGLDCSESLHKAVMIDKKYLLRKADIFNELELYSDCLECLDEFLENHFTLDDDFVHAIEAKAKALEALGLDSRHEREILSQIV